MHYTQLLQSIVYASQCIMKKLLEISNINISNIKSIIFLYIINIQICTNVDFYKYNMKFEEAIIYLLAEEGGFVNNPRDPGVMARSAVLGSQSGTRLRRSRKTVSGCAVSGITSSVFSNCFSL